MPTEAHPPGHDAATAALVRDSDSKLAIRTLLRVFAVQDALLLIYLFVVSLLIAWSSSVDPILAEASARRVYVAIAVLTVGAFVSRGGLDGPTWLNALIYRVCIVGVLLDNYLMLRNLLPLVRPDTVDATLYELDLRIFGVEPALWLERYNERPIVEWFAFFYFSYFIIAAVYMTGIVWLRRGGRETSEFAIGVLLVFCLGQLGYMAVPGFGPVGFLASTFHHALRGGFFWACVTGTVSAGSAMKDIFPSLHTAFPTFLTLYAWRRARFDRRFRYVAVATGFFAVNIIISTMLLRWHFAIDVVAGLALGSTAAVLAPRIAGAEARLRSRMGLPQAWSFGPPSKTPRWWLPASLSGASSGD